MFLLLCSSMFTFSVRKCLVLCCLVYHFKCSLWDSEKRLLDYFVCEATENKTDYDFEFEYEDFTLLPSW